MNPRRAIVAMVLAIAAHAAGAASVLVGQHLQPRITFGGEPFTTSLFVREISSTAEPARAIEPSVPGREYYPGAYAGDMRGTQALAVLHDYRDGHYWSSLVEIDTVTAKIVETLDLVHSDADTWRMADGVAWDVPRELAYVIVEDKFGAEIWRISRKPLAVQSKIPLACPDDGGAGIFTVLSGGDALLTWCRDDFVTLDAATGAVKATMTVDVSVNAYTYDDVANRLYMGIPTTSGSTIRAYDATTLKLVHSYTELPSIDSMFVDASGNVMFTTQPSGPYQTLYRLNPSLGTVLAWDTLQSQVRFESRTGRTPRVAGVLAPYCPSSPCPDPLLGEYDVATRRLYTSVLDDRPADDPTRKDYFAAVDMLAATARVVPAVEYVRTDKDHYFVTADAGEIAALDSGAFAGWARTGESLSVFARADDSGDPTSPVCRFYGRPEAGLDTHFYSALPQECAAMKPMFGDAWVQETLDAFDVYPVGADGNCGNATAPVYRLFNGRGDANHRYTTSNAIRAQMMAKGWLPEGFGADGVGFCVPRH